MLTALAAVVPIRAVDAIARLLRLTDVVAVFCEHCPSWTDETNDEETEAA